MSSLCRNSVLVSVWEAGENCHLMKASSTSLLPPWSRRLRGVCSSCLWNHYGPERQRYEIIHLWMEMLAGSVRWGRPGSHEGFMETGVPFTPSPFLAPGTPPTCCIVLLQTLGWVSELINCLPDRARLKETQKLEDMFLVREMVVTKGI